MKILVAIKRVQDYNIKVRPKSDGSDVDLEGVKMGVNPFDENAIEEQTTDNLHTGFTLLLTLLQNTGSAGSRASRKFGLKNGPANEISVQKKICEEI